MLDLDPHSISIMIDIGLPVIAVVAAISIFCLDLEPAVQLVGISVVVAVVSVIHFAVQAMPRLAPAIAASQ
jgi:hypothetical protein